MGGCTLEAVEQMDRALGGKRALVLDEVTSLLDKHLLRKAEQGSDAPRVLMHETIREYGLEVLAQVNSAPILEVVLNAAESDVADYQYYRYGYKS